MRLARYLFLFIIVVVMALVPAAHDGTMEYDSVPPPARLDTQ